jgi:hypothetical protein
VSPSRRFLRDPSIPILLVRCLSELLSALRAGKTEIRTGCQRRRALALTVDNRRPALVCSALERATDTEGVIDSRGMDTRGGGSRSFLGEEDRGRGGLDRLRDHLLGSFDKLSTIENGPDGGQLLGSSRRKRFYQEVHTVTDRAGFDRGGRGKDIITRNTGVHS